jgi:IS5 family transposase
VIVTTGKVYDYSMAGNLPHGDEATAHGDRRYGDKTREPDRPRSHEDIGPCWFVPLKRTKGYDTTPEQRRANRLLAALCSAVEHPFLVLKRQFACTKVCYRGLFKNAQHVFSQFALVNLYLARHVIAPGG